MGVQITQEMISGAQATEKKYGVPASITLGQIMLESGGSYKGGLSGLAYYYNNLFGITATTADKTSGNAVYMTNKSGEDGHYYATYSSVEDSIEAHGQLLTNDRYASQTKSAITIEQYAQGIANGGYATDPNYASKLVSIIQSNNLTKYDGNWNTNAWKDAVHVPSDKDSYTGIYGRDETYAETVTGTTIEETLTQDTDLKAWGDIVVIVIVILLIGACVLFFMSAFNISIPSPSNTVSKIISKGVKTDE